MSQQSRPIADLVVGGWDDAPLYEKLDESSPNDSDFVGISDPANSVFEVSLAAISAPPWHSGPSVLNVRVRRTTVDPVSVRFQLLDGSNLIAQQVASPTTDFENIQLALTQAQINSIQDFSDLRVRVSASCDNNEACCPSCVFYSFSISAVNPGGLEPSSGCTMFNRSYRLGVVSEPCQWWEVFPSGNAFLEDDGTDMNLLIGSTAIDPPNQVFARYRLSKAQWNCNGCNTMSLIETQGLCTGWPSTVNVCCTETTP